jgi:NADH:ubiquinone oxidoreductase subunit 3 (subunit A)
VEEVAYLLLATLSAVAAAYAFHRRYAPRSGRGAGKLAPYACGEDLPPERVPVRVTLYKYICLFVVTDVTAMLLAFSLLPLPPAERATARVLVLAYCAVLVLAIARSVS